MSARLPKAHKAHELVLEASLFTFWRVGAVLAGLSALALGGCASPAARAPAAGAGLIPPSGPSYATVEAVRPIAPAMASGDSRSQILDAMGVAVQPTPPASEFVLQTDDGLTLSVVQADPLHLMPGQRVILVPGPTPTLVPAAPAS
jgi:outer membrane lipoprotein SlyB